MIVNEKTISIPSAINQAPETRGGINEKTISIRVSGYQKSNKLNKQSGVEYYQKKCQNYRHDKR